MKEDIKQAICKQLETEKAKMFVTHRTCDAALKFALEIMPESTHSAVTTAILGYHNTLINQIQSQILSNKGTKQ